MISLLAALVLAPSPDAARVLLVINGWSTPSQSIGKYYQARRGLAKENVVWIETPPEEEISYENYRQQIEAPVKKALTKLKKVDFIVLTKDVPLRFSNRGQSGGYAVDATLAFFEKPLEPIKELTEAEITRLKNPYFGRREPFSHAKHGFYLVTRLDGYSDSDVKRLIDSSLRATPDKGLFLFDEAANRKEGDYLETQKGLSAAAVQLKSKGFTTQLETTDNFLAPTEPLMGYASWGSNDGAFNLDAYRRLRFKPGSLAETFVSTSGRTFRRAEGGQSLIADLIEQGLTGVKGYVSEPYTFALAKPEILFDRYVSGFNLAESFYMASPVVMWKDVVVGDPLCAPYAKKK